MIISRVEWQHLLLDRHPSFLIRQRQQLTLTCFGSERKLRASLIFDNRQRPFSGFRSLIK